MGQSFDPYHKWLGIPPEEQPPSYYRLLGIKDFESDPDVIEAAADQRMGHLRRYQTSRHAELSQRLLNEVSAARICLLNPSKRAAYDEQLKLAVLAATAPPAPQPPDVAFPVVEEEWSPRAMRPGRRKPSSNVGPIIGVALAAGLLFVAFVAWKIASRETPNVAQPPSAVKTSAVKTSAVKTSAEQQNHPEQPRAAVPQVGTGIGSKTAAPPKAQPGPGFGREALSPMKPRPNVHSQRDHIKQPSSQQSKAVLKVDSPSADSATAAPDTAKPVAPPGLHLVDGQEPTRVAVPSAAEQEAAMKQAQDLYRDEFAKAKTPKAREALAGKLLDQAKQQVAGDAAGAFVLLRLARDMAAQAGDGATAFQAIDALAEKFELDGVTMKTDVLADVAKKAHMPVDHLSIAQQAADLMDDAFTAGNYAQAAHLGRLATAEGQKAHDRDIVLQARNRLKEVQGAIKLGEDFEVARAKLSTQPDDADANTIAASYYCFLKNDWQRGLPYLAKGHDAMLRALAQRELQESPKDSTDRVKLADAWWDLAQKADSRRKEKMLLHAGAWYAKAQPSLPAGMVKLKVEKRLDEIEKLDRKSTGGGLSPAL